MLVASPGARQALGSDGLCRLRYGPLLSLPSLARVPTFPGSPRVVVREAVLPGRPEDAGRATAAEGRPGQ